jgi:AraC-like DNA-binding protein
MAPLAGSYGDDTGFNHPGRFAEAYRKRFGETPSETLGWRKSDLSLPA